RLAGDDPAGARRLTSAAFWAVLPASLVVSATLCVLAPQLIALLAPGFSPATAGLAALMLRIALVGMALDLSKAVLVAAHIASGRAILTQVLGALWYVTWPVAVWIFYRDDGPLVLAGAYALAHLVVFSL